MFYEICVTLHNCMRVLDCKIGKINYSKGQAEFKTENITTLSILKDIITKNATKKRITLEISTSNELTYSTLDSYIPTAPTFRYQ